jgi:uncharacterized protein (UPF0332 family)
MDYGYLTCLERAQEFVQAAELCLEHKLYNAAVTRAYYGALYAAIAALDCYSNDLNAKDMLSGKVHKVVPGEFDSRFIRKSKTFERQKGVLHELQTLREDADYRSGVSDRKSSKAVDKARAFLDTILMKMKSDGHVTEIS